MLKKVIVISLTLLTIFFMIGCEREVAPTEDDVSDLQEEDSKLMNIGTAGMGGTFYYLGSAIGEVINREDIGVHITAESTAGGIENLRRIKSGELDLGMINAWEYGAVLEDETVGPEDVLLIGSLYNSYFKLTMGPDAPYTTVQDYFDGKEGSEINIGIGEPGSAIQTVAGLILAAYELTVDDVNAHPLSQSEQADALKDGRIDLALLGSGAKVAAVADVAQSLNGVTILEIDEYTTSFLQQRMPFLENVEVVAGTYTGQDEPVTTVGYLASLWIDPEIDEDTVYEFVKTLYENSQAIGDIHPSGYEINPETALKSCDYYIELGAKFHPGAIRYFKEVGVWNPAYE
jgi:uncharacterized protein